MGKSFKILKLLFVNLQGAGRRGMWLAPRKRCNGGRPGGRRGRVSRRSDGTQGAERFDFQLAALGCVWVDGVINSSSSSSDGYTVKVSVNR